MDVSARYRLHHFDGPVQGDYNTGHMRIWNTGHMRIWSRRIPIRLSLTQEAVARIGFDGNLYNYRVVTGCASRAARLFRRLLEIVRSMIAPQLIHFHA
jgi:hypothetical protein